MFKQHVICVVGPDRIGKTTMVKLLSHCLNIPSYKASKEQSDFLNSQDKFLQQLRLADPRQLDLLEQIKFSMIMDRGWVCEYPYSKLYGRSTDFNQLMQNDARYAALGTKIVFLYRTSYAGLQDDLDPTLTDKRLQIIHDGYEEFFQITRCEVVKLCVDPHVGEMYYDEQEKLNELIKALFHTELIKGV
jgi:ABC-type cobalamin/Fe3+-siderophores transport system ATPase subunit